ncbi:MAG TPA: hypothetical protein VGM63_22605, partial [Mucilaginibacter sp.]
MQAIIKIYHLRQGLHILLCVFVLSFFSLSESQAQNRTRSIIEITGATGSKPDAGLLKSILKMAHIPSSALYQWQNHLVIYGFMNSPAKLEQQIA